MKHDQNTKHNSTTERSVMRSKGPYFLIQCEGDENTLLQLLHCSLSAFQETVNNPFIALMCFLLFPNSTVEVSPLRSNHVQNKFIRSFSLSRKLKGKKKKILKKKSIQKLLFLIVFMHQPLTKNITLFHLSHVKIPDSINLCLGFET